MSERDKDLYLALAIGAGLMFIVCATIGLLDSYHALDPILDFLHIP